MANETNQKLENKELEVEEVNVYSSACGAVKYSCENDCVITHDCFVTCVN